jgi:hypothetical protein
MRFKILLIGLLIAVVAVSGCTSFEQGLKQLGKDVSEDLKTKNIEAYLNFCVTIEDKKYLIVASELTSDEKKTQLALLSTNVRDLNRAREDRSANFNDIAWQKGWEQAIVQKIILGKRLNQDGIICYEYIVVQFKKKILPDLRIGKVVKVKKIWKIMDDQALSFNSRI